jgi:hypothetical protein
VLFKVLGESGSNVSRNLVSAVALTLTDRKVVPGPNESLVRDFVVFKFFNAAALLGAARKLLGLPDRESKYSCSSLARSWTRCSRRTWSSSGPSKAPASCC